MARLLRLRRKSVPLTRNCGRSPGGRIRPDPLIHIGALGEKQARSIKYQLTIAKLPLAKDLDDFQFESTPINETLVNDLAGGGFIAQQRNAVLVGGTESGSYCPPRYAVRMPSHFDVDRQTTAPEYGVDPQRA